VLRLVADHHIVTLEADRVGLTDRGRLLCRAHPSSLSAAFATVGTAEVAHGLTNTLRTGRAATPRVLGMGYWEDLATHPDQQALFDQAMVQRAGALSLACVPVLDWPPQGRSPTSPAGPAPCWRPCSGPPRPPTASWSTSPRCWGAPDPCWHARGWRPLCAVSRGPVRPATPG